MGSVDGPPFYDHEREVEPPPEVEPRPVPEIYDQGGDLPLILLHVGLFAAGLIGLGIIILYNWGR